MFSGYVNLGGAKEIEYQRRNSAAQAQERRPILNTY